MPRRCDNLRPPVKIRDLFSAKKPLFSFEFFPPKTDDGEANLATALAELARLEPTFVSVTYGAGGTPACNTPATNAPNGYTGYNPLRTTNTGNPREFGIQIAFRH